jgi:hypothetical protein
MKTSTTKTPCINTVVADLVVPVWDHCKVIRGQDGQFYLWETNRWGMDDSFRTITKGYADSLVALSFKGPDANYRPVANRVAAGCIG